MPTVAVAGWIQTEGIFPPGQGGFTKTWSPTKDPEIPCISSLVAVYKCPQSSLRKQTPCPLTSFSLVSTSQEAGSTVMIFYGQFHGAKCLQNILLDGKGLF